MSEQTDPVAETRAALIEFLRRPLEAGTTQLWPGVDHMLEGLDAAEAYATEKALVAAERGFTAGYGEKRHTPEWVGPHEPVNCMACRFATLRARLLAGGGESHE